MLEWASVRMSLVGGRSFCVSVVGALVGAC